MSIISRAIVRMPSKLKLDKPSSHEASRNGSHMQSVGMVGRLMKGQAMQIDTTAVDKVILDITETLKQKDLDIIHRSFLIELRAKLCLLGDYKFQTASR